MHSLLIRKKTLHTLVFTTCSWTALADTAQSESRSGGGDSLKKEIVELRKRDNEQVQAINILLERIKRLESDLSSEPLAVKNNTPAKSKSAKVPEHSRLTDDDKAAQKPQKYALSAFDELLSNRLTIESGFNYSSFDRQQLMLNGFLALDAIFLGLMSVDEVETSIFTWQTGLRYRVNHRVQFDTQIPYIFRQTLYRSRGVEGATNKVIEETLQNDLALGDISVGSNIVIIPETPSSPAISVSLRVKMPTGSSPYGIDIVEVADSNGNLTVPSELPTSNGVWSVSSVLSFTRTVDPAVIFMNVGGTYHQRKKFADIDANPETASPGEVMLGNSLQFGIGIGYALNERTSITTAYSQQFQDKSKTRFEKGDWQIINGSRAAASTFNNTVTYSLSRHWSTVTTLGIGLTKDASDVSFGTRFSYFY